MPAFTRAELADLNVFMTIVRRRSFRQSAIELGVTTSALSHAMKNLESRLGVKLLNRTSRSVVPTQAGSALAERLEQGFQTIAEALAELDVHRDAPVGRLRLLLGPVLPGFFARYPELQLEVAVEDRMVDIVADGFDAGIRYGGTVPRDMIAMPLTGELRWIVVASPDYLSRHGRPQVPEDLLRHQCMRIRLGDNTPYKWELGDGPQAIHLDVPGSLGANETDILLQATLDGLGLAYCLELRVAEELRSGRLETVLPEWSSMGPPFCMYYPSRRQAQPGLRQLIESIRALGL